MTKVEEVARAIDPSTWGNWDNWVRLKGYSDAEKAEEYAASPSLHKSLERARAAIEAMRGPTDAMIDAAWQTIKNATPEQRIAIELARPADAHRAKMRQRFGAMIDAALSE